MSAALQLSPLRVLHLSAGALVVAAVLAGCGASGQQEIQAWMQQQRAQTKPKVEPLPEPKKFTPQAYTEAAATDPFSSQKLAQALRRAAGQSAASSALVAPEMARRKEPLESYPLDTMVMVGSMIRQGRPVALVRVDNLIYQVRPGMYLGQNYGKITRVTETEVVLREIVQDPAGEWVERAATLQLQERSK
ncbi:pilus assembly protein PilP [Ramlibacter sp. MAHUQ-53]|uniref:pilus assembly protein PilP n=1 Tax=unclassified Ramlibacter TaxID=2617605 RepID=UPI00363039F4